MRAFCRCTCLHFRFQNNAEGGQPGVVHTGRSHHAAVDVVVVLVVAHPDHFPIPAALQRFRGHLKGKALVGFPVQGKGLAGVFLKAGEQQRLEIAGIQQVQPEAAGNADFRRRHSVDAGGPHRSVAFPACTLAGKEPVFSVPAHEAVHFLGAGHHGFIRARAAGVDAGAPDGKALPGPGAVRLKGVARFQKRPYGVPVRQTPVVYQGGAFVRPPCQHHEPETAGLHVYARRKRHGVAGNGPRREIRINAGENLLFAGFKLHFLVGPRPDAVVVLLPDGWGIRGFGPHLCRHHFGDGDGLAQNGRQVEAYATRPGHGIFRHPAAVLHRLVADMVAPQVAAADASVPA